MAALFFRMITLKNTNYDIITVGAGAAGLAAAISAKRNNRDLKIAILEAQSKAGKKILVTGNVSEKKSLIATLRMKKR